MIEVMDQLSPSVMDSFVHVAHSDSVSASVLYGLCIATTNELFTSQSSLFVAVAVAYHFELFVSPLVSAAESSC